MSYLFRAVLSPMFALTLGCGEIRIVPPDATLEDVPDDAGDAVAMPLAVTIESPQNGASVNVGDNVHFVARVTGGTVSYDQLTAVWTTADNKVLASGPLDATARSVFDKADLPAGPQAIHVEVADGNGVHAGRDLGLLINTPPTAPTVTIQPEKPTTLDDLVPVLTKPPTDVDRAPDKLHVRFDWHKAGDATVHPGGVNGELAAGTHKRGETWIVTAVADDGTSESPGATAQVVIGDAPPSQPVLKIIPGTVDLLTEVTCAVAVAASDPDGDAVSIVWGWRIGDYGNPGVTQNAINVHKLASDATGTPPAVGAQLTCTAIASDDQRSAPLATSPTVTVQAFDVCAKANTCDKNATCANTDTLEPICTCVNGFTGDGTTCIDVDECLSGYCSAHASCNNTIGGFQCKCQEGYTGNGVTCTDIDECQAAPGPCNIHGLCANSAGSFTCVCAPGWSGDGLTCTDVDECQTGIAACDVNATCANTDGGYTCTCSNGFVGDGHACQDFDECLAGNAGCPVDSTCKNLSGGFACPCNPGYKDFGDGICVQQDECSSGEAVCSVDAICTDTPGSFMCACKPGFSGNGKDCSDIDECADGTAMCGANATCANTPGAFVCSCKSGYTGDGKTCTDINECQKFATPCAANAKCDNTDGDYLCTCQPGFFGDGKSYCATQDLCPANACAAHATCATEPIPPVATCNSVPGTANAGAEAECICDSGWEGCGLAGTDCTEIDECALGTAGCASDATCTNTPGSFTCACKPGFSGNGLTCFDINECAATMSPCDVNASCKNAIGSFSCTCPAGFVGDGSAGGIGCVDIDECSTSTPCGVDATCANTPGSYTCTCLPGYSGDGLTCADINECLLGIAGCAPDATCMNTVGSALCTCKSGYSGDGKTCMDIDECSTGAANCSTNGLCTNTPGSFSCACQPGYSGDGLVCVDIDECPASEWSWDFSTQGVVNWTLDAPFDYAPSNPQVSAVPPPVSWQLWNGLLYYGNPAAGNYDTSLNGTTWANKGTATGPAVTLSAHPWHQLGFDVLIATDAATSVDKFTVQLVLGSGATEQVVAVWDKSSQTAAMGVNKHYTAYLSGYGGKSVRVRFAFDTVDGSKNATLGVEVGSLSIRGAGSPCNAYATCTNTPGSFTCTCNAPYAGDGVQGCGVLGSQGQPATSCKAILDLDGVLAHDVYWLKWSAAPAVQLWCDAAGWTRVVDNDFNTSAGAWLPKTLSVCGTSGLLGGADIAGKSYAINDALGNLPGHTQMRVQGTVQCIDAWVGNSVMLQTDSTQVWSDTVTNPAVSVLNPNSCGNAALADLKRNINVTFAHSAASALLQFVTTLTADPSVASYGIDDISIWVR